MKLPIFHASSQSRSQRWVKVAPLQLDILRDCRAEHTCVSSKEDPTLVEMTTTPEPGVSGSSRRQYMSNTFHGLTVPAPPFPLTPPVPLYWLQTLQVLSSGDMNAVPNFSPIHGICTWNFFEIAPSTLMTNYTVISISGRLLKKAILKTNLWKKNESSERKIQFPFTYDSF